MKTLIIYASKYGAAKNSVKLLEEKIRGSVEAVNIEEDKKGNLDFSNYDNIIIGGSIYMGQIQKEIREFAIENIDKIRGKKVGLFISCLREGEEGLGQIDQAFPEDLVKIASVKENFGGEIKLKKMKFLERAIIKKVAKLDKDISTLSMEKISDFADHINN